VWTPAAGRSPVVPFGCGQ